MYRVIHFFMDLQDNGFEYRVGDAFPHSGFSVSEKRLTELSTDNNKQGKPLIELVRDNAEEESVKKRGRKPKSE